jgi:hypothetical protein
MKRWLTLLISFLILAAPVSSLAAPASLSRVSSSGAAISEGTVQVISYKAYIKVHSDIIQTDASLIIKNTSDEEESKMMVGMPSHINQGSLRLNDLEMVMDGSRQRLSNRRDRTRVEEAEVDLPSHWSALAINLQPGEYKVIDISYTIENQKSDNGAQSIFIPLEYLKSWSGIPQRVEITAELDDGSPYLFEPNPSTLPHEYDKKGRLTWTFSNTNPPESIQIFYRPIEQLAAGVVSAQASGDRSITAIVNSFMNKSYSLAISQIETYLEEESEAALENELLFIKALSHQELLQTAEAVELFNRLEAKPMFGELEGTFKNKIIYDTYNHMQSLLTDRDTLFTYLDSSKNYVMDNAMFLMWMEEELTRLEPAPAPEPELNQTEEKTDPSDSSQEEKSKGNELVKSVTIGGYEISVEFLFLGILAIVILLTTIISRRRKRKTRNRGYLFR